MPRAGPRRPLVAIRLSDEGIAHIDRQAKSRDLNRSEMVRLMLAYASAKMPKDWTP